MILTEGKSDETYAYLKEENNSARKMSNFAGIVARMPSGKNPPTSITMQPRYIATSAIKEKIRVAGNASIDMPPKVITEMRRVALTANIDVRKESATKLRADFFLVIFSVGRYSAKAIIPKVARAESQSDTS